MADLESSKNTHFDRYKLFQIGAEKSIFGDIYEHTRCI